MLATTILAPVSHFAQQNSYILNHHQLRILACTVARNFLLCPNHWIDGASTISMTTIEKALLTGQYEYDDTILQALASIRNGPIITIEESGRTMTHIPVEDMLRILFAPGPAPAPTPPIYILHRTSAPPDHYDATRSRTESSPNPTKPTTPPSEEEPNSSTSPTDYSATILLRAFRRRRNR